MDSGFGLRYLEPEKVRVWLPEGAALPRVEILNDRCVPVAKIVRIFPIEDPNRFLSILDERDKEIGILENLEGMDENSREAIAEQLDRRYFSPVISRIAELKMDAGMWLFTVETQRGATEFYVRGWRDNAHEVTKGRWQIHSVDGQRFDILDYEALDERSKSLLDKVF